jgi:hypothetical protein
MQADAAARSTLPAWMENLEFFGDLRLRYEGECRSTHDGYDRKTRNRARFRLRFGVEKSWLDEQLVVGFRLATGSADDSDWDDIGGSDPTSSNQTFDGFWSQKPIWVDRAYAIYRPNSVPGLMLTGGKIKNPFHTSKLFIDSDVNPEGVWGQYTFSGMDSFEPFVGAGYFVAEEINQSVNNAYDTILMAYSAGFGWEVAEGVEWSMAANIWDYDHYDTNFVSHRGNTSVGWNLDFLVLNLHNQVKFKAMGLPMAVYFDWAHNCNEGETADELQGEDNAYHAGVKVGTNKKRGDWSVKYEYGWLEANSMPGFWADSDFGRLDRQGHVVKGKYNLTNFLTAGLACFLTEPIRSTDGEDDTFKVQADLVWEF